jgi:hypothetical protein
MKRLIELELEMLGKRTRKREVADVVEAPSYKP